MNKNVVVGDSSLQQSRIDEKGEKKTGGEMQQDWGKTSMEIGQYHFGAVAGSVGDMVAETYSSCLS